MYRKIDDFAESWGWETETTLKMFASLTDTSLSQKVTPKGRTLGFIAWHIVTTIPEMLQQAGLPATGPKYDSPVPKSAQAISDEYTKAAASVVAAVKSKWTDAQLLDKIPMYGEQWAKRAVLIALIGHQSHHRGQMSVLMRQAGLKVPGTYGPAQEDWAKMGMPALP